MARLVLINGAPGCGKSTVARRFAADHPLTLCLDIDVVRGMLGAWLDHPDEAGRVARDLALAMARVRLLAGGDVVVPQYLGRLDLVERLDDLAREVGVPFVEVALLTDREEAVRRFVRRATAPESAEHCDASELLERSGGVEALGPMHDRLLEVVAARPATRRVRSIDGQVEETYRVMLALIGDGDGHHGDEDAVASPLRIALVGSGAGSTAAAVMDAAADGRIRATVGLAISNNSASGVITGAAARGIPTAHLSGVTHPDSDALDAAMLRALEASGAELVVLAGYMKKLGPRVLARYDGRIVNTHPALLPAYGGRGMYGDRVHAAALADGASTTGATVHLVTAEYDEGRTLAQARVPVLPGDDLDSLRERVQAAEKALLIDFLASRAQGSRSAT